VDVDGRAVVFLSGNSGGKTSLAAALMRAGGRLLSDDVLPLEERCGTLVGRPGYPQMRMWPAEATHFLGRCDGLARVHPAYSKRRVPVGAGGFGAFCAESRPLSALYLPQRLDSADGKCDVSEVTPGEAVIELVRHSFSPHIVAAVGLQPERLSFFARLVQGVPVRRLLYPAGLDRLPAAVDAILRDQASA